MTCMIYIIPFCNIKTPFCELKSVNIHSAWFAPFFAVESASSKSNSTEDLVEVDSETSKDGLSGQAECTSKANGQSGGSGDCLKLSRGTKENDLWEGTGTTTKRAIPKEHGNMSGEQGATRRPILRKQTPKKVAVLFAKGKKRESKSGGLKKEVKPKCRIPYIYKRKSATEDDDGADKKARKKKKKKPKDFSQSKWRCWNFRQ